MNLLIPIGKLYAFVSGTLFHPKTWFNLRFFWNILQENVFFQNVELILHLRETDEVTGESLARQNSCRLHR